jgi:RNA polymerase sigma-70 factor (ECF subfamily)
MLATSKLSDLLAQVAEGNEASFSELYQHTSAKLYGVALRILRSKELAEDVLQDAFVKIWSRARDFDPAIAAPLTWMSAIVRNRALDEVRRRAARPVGSSDGTEIENLASDDEHPIVGLEREDDVKRLFQCLEGLEAEKKEIVKLAYLNGLSRDELARRFSRPEGTIKTWLHRSLAQLKGCLEA